jgi:BlaI family transcriptional regulator, penicillinase repressor
MARPGSEHPTPAELEVLQVLWDRGPATVREVLEILNGRKARAYTSVMSLLNVMAEKGLVERQPKGRAFLYSPAQAREATLSGMVGDLLERAFSGSANALVTHLLAEAQPTQRELDEIRKLIESFRGETESRGGR